MKKNNKYTSEVVSDIFKSDNLDINSTIKNLKHGISEECYIVSNDKQAKFYNKAMGTYKLISIPNVLFMIDSEIEYTTKVISDVLKEIVGKLSKKDKVLVVGLGNRHISSDSLGAKVVSNISINFFNTEKPKVMAICPSVLGLTGIPTYDTVKGVVDRINPTHLILIDSLCAGSVERLGKSIQISNTGICPGSGIGNKQKCIDKNLAPNVYSIGVPLLIYASTFIKNAFEDVGVNNRRINSIMQKYKKTSKNNDILDILNAIKDIYFNNLDDIIVSIKDIEECVKILSYIISSAINSLFKE